MAGVSSTAVSSDPWLLLQAAHRPSISPLDVNALIERELSKAAKATSSAAKDSILSSSSPTNINTTAPKHFSDNDRQAVPVPDRKFGDDLGRTDNCDGKPSTKTAADSSSLHRLQADYSDRLCSVSRSNTAELQFHCKPDLTADVKKSDPSLCSPAEKTDSSLLAEGHLRLPVRSSTVLAGLGPNGLSAKEINNNNCRRGYAGVVGKEREIGVRVGSGAAVRKSERCNRGRRYHELMSQGVLQHQTARKRCESLTA